MQANVVATGEFTEIRLEGTFDMNTHRDFRDAVILALKNDSPEIRVSLREVSYIDSSALGMLLMLREMAEKAGRQVSLAGANGAVLRALQFAKLDTVFKILA